MNLELVGDIREMSFQNVVDQILKPNGVNLGGFPEDIFQSLSEDEKEKLICNICFMIVNDARQCENKHLFCRTCIFAWSLTYGENSQKCPMCRVPQTEYPECPQVTRQLQDKTVTCPEDKCTFKAPLKVFLMHGHGKARFSNTHVDFEKLQPRRPEGARLLMLPTLNPTGSTRRERAESIRSQLQQGRMMIHQMMTLLQLEMMLRQQAVTSFQEATDPTTRLQRLDEVMALNEQLNEVGTVLSTMLNSPLSSNIISSNLMARDNRPARHPFQWETPVGGRGEQTVEDSDGSDSSSDESSGVISTARRTALANRRTLTSNQAAAGLNSQRDATLGRSDIGEALLRNMSETRSQEEDVPVISEGRHLSDFSQANIASTTSSVTTDIHPRVLLGRDRMARGSLRPSESLSSTTNLIQTSVTENATTRSTIQRLPSAGTQRGTVPTTVNQRNQTIPSHSSTQVNSQLSGVPNSVARQQSSLNIDEPRGRLSTGQYNRASERRGDTPRPPSTQPSEAGESDSSERTVVPRGSTAHREVQRQMDGHRPASGTRRGTTGYGTTGRGTTTEGTVGGGTTGEGTTARSTTIGRTSTERTSVTELTGSTRSTGVHTQSTTARLTDTGPRNSSNHTDRTPNTTSQTPRSQVSNQNTVPSQRNPTRSRPPIISADSSQLTSSIPQSPVTSNPPGRNQPASSSFGSIERLPAEPGSDGSVSGRSHMGRRRANSLQRPTERRPTLHDRSPARQQRNTGPTRQVKATQPQTQSTERSPQRQPRVNGGGGQGSNRNKAGNVPRIRQPLQPVTGNERGLLSTTNNGRPLYRARRRSEIKQELERSTRDNM